MEYFALGARSDLFIKSVEPLPRPVPGPLFSIIHTIPCQYLVYIKIKINALNISYCYHKIYKGLRDLDG